MRSVGVLEHGTAELAHHDHLAFAGERSSDLARVATQAFATAPSGDALMLCLDPGADWDPTTVFADELADGRLEIVDNAAAYAVTRAGGDAVAQLRAFEDVLELKLAEGFTGIRVVADNTSFLTGSDANTARWLAWEQRTDAWQARRPVTGVCWFDSRRVPAHRLAAALKRHPATAGAAAPRWWLHHEDGRVHLSGEIDAFDTSEVMAALDVEFAVHADGPGLVVDLARTTYLHHRVLWALTRPERGVIVHNAPPVVTRLREVLGASLVAD